MKPGRWHDAVSHLGTDVTEFLKSLLSQAGRSILYIAGAGFDPRASHLGAVISQQPATRRALLIRENRPDPEPELLRRAEENEAHLKLAFPEHEVIHINVFDQDHTVVGGQEAVREIRQRVMAEDGLTGITDVFVDMSALSIGISFPIVGLLYELLAAGTINLHLIAATGGPEVEAAVVAEHAENYQNPWGFKGDQSTGDSSWRLWIPQLASPKRTAFSILFQELAPQETVPIFPFPARNPRGVEKLLDQFSRELMHEWRVDTRHMLFAAEDDPLHLYRTVARIHASRKDIYTLAGETAETVLSPLGSKALAIGALLVALEHKLPIAYVEARRFEIPAGGFSGQADPARYVHVWVAGEVYARQVSACA